MHTARFPFRIFLLALFSFSLFPYASIARKHKHCGSAFCGNINISFPFRLNTQPPKCGYKVFELVCDSNNRTYLPMNFHGKFYVQNISYHEKIVHLVDDALKDNCSLPHIFSRSSDFDRLKIFMSVSSLSTMYLVKCRTHIFSSLYINVSRCPDRSPNPTNYFYFLDQSTPLSHFDPSRIVQAQVPMLLSSIVGLSTLQIYSKLFMGLQFQWLPERSIDYSQFGWWANWLYDAIRKFFLHSDLAPTQPIIYQVQDYKVIQYWRTDEGAFVRVQIVCLTIIGFMMLRTFMGFTCLIVVLIQKFKRRHLSADDMIENFLRSQNDFKPIRYSHSDLKQITGCFKDKLGKGGYGSVFKGKLRSGQFVAVKLLDKSKANGQDFINEVATIGRIRHANVVQLVGFCVQESIQALLYDFMPNGSLDRIIFSQEESRILSWQKMLEIVLGSAQAIEYLHRGCEMQILHFDIKPHNILLYENYNPKNSDFGLAKLYAVDKSIISITAVRGTLGYMAPKLFYKSIGDISYKADVYSFGMMLMDIVGRRKNLMAENSSQIYFPSWICDKLEESDNIVFEDVTGNENEIMRKMIIVALWCVQMNPTSRPSMSKVMEMLESEVGLLEMPPKPSFFSQDMPSKDIENSLCTTTSFGTKDFM